MEVHSAIQEFLIENAASDNKGGDKYGIFDSIMPIT